MTKNYYDKALEKTGINEFEFEKMVKDKRRDFHFLVTREGAALLVARDHGIELLDDDSNG